jgi:NADPH-dependent 2,4-dienoyl-CoA reductase/sulfur reductase-like enzyme
MGDGCVMRERLLIVGGDAAGMSAASVARRRRPPDALDVVAFERGEHTSYAACGLPYFVAGLIPTSEQLVARNPAQHRAVGIDVRTRHEVVAIDTAARTVRVRDLATSRDLVESYDEIVIATGSVPIRPSLPNVDADGVFGIQTIGDGVVLDAWLRDRAPRRAVVVGGGYIGLEMAEAMQRRGIATTLVEQLPQPMATMDADMGALVADALRAIGVDVRVGTGVQGFVTGRDGEVRAVTTAAGDLAADVVVLGLGVKPNTQLARDAGVPLGVRDGIVVDDRMHTEVEGVWAAGDCVVSRHRVSGRPVVVALGTHANKQGRVVGSNVTGGELRFPGVIGTAVTKICEYEVARTGLTEREAGESGVDAVAATIEGSTRAHYYPDAQPITVKCVVARGSGRLLGAQIVGREGAAKRIDVMAAAIWNEMTADDFAQLDLGYAPPFSPVWDPVLIAARKAADAA